MDSPLCITLSSDDEDNSVSDKPPPKILRRTVKNEVVKNSSLQDASLMGFKGSRNNADQYTYLRPLRQQCEYCDKNFSFKSSLHKHIQRCHKSPSQDSLNKPTSSLKFTCETCGHAFATSTDLLIHQLVHNNNPPFKCDICDLNFKAKFYFIVHLKSTKHKAMEKYKLRLAKASLQENLGCYKCEKCDKTFSKWKNLKIHSTVHKDVFPHKCEICQKNFKWRSAYKKHLLTNNHAMMEAQAKDFLNGIQFQVENQLLVVDSEVIPATTIPSTKRSARKPKLSSSMKSSLTSKSVSKKSASVRKQKEKRISLDITKTKISRQESDASAERESNVVNNIPTFSGNPSQSNGQPIDKLLASQPLQPGSLGLPEQYFTPQVLMGSYPLFEAQNNNPYPVLQSVMIPQYEMSQSNQFPTTSMFPFVQLVDPSVSFEASHGSYTSQDKQSNLSLLACSHCPQQFEKDKDLRIHFLCAHPKNCWQCPVCFEVLLSPAEMTLHFTTYHPQKK